MPENPRLIRALTSLEGLAIGDAFGEMFFSAPTTARAYVAESRLPPKPWWHTDDTEMALAIVEVLMCHGHVEQDALARRFAQRFDADPDRGYGKMARIILRAVLNGEDWRTASASAFSGLGSMGNGGAMRAAPLGAWFADDLDVVVSEARAAAEVTHAHPEGQAGAVAVAIAAAVAWLHRGEPAEQVGRAIFEEVLRHTPAGETREGVARGAALTGATAREAARALGNGTLVTASDTVPYAIWSAARNVGDFGEAIIETVSGGGDCDTTCAMVGGIVALHVGLDGIPATWRAAKEVFRLMEGGD